MLTHEQENMEMLVDAFLGSVVVTNAPKSSVSVNGNN
jgi:hypothetical protein